MYLKKQLNTECYIYTGTVYYNTNYIILHIIDKTTNTIVNDSRISFFNGVNGEVVAPSKLTTVQSLLQNEFLSETLSLRGCLKELNIYNGVIYDISNLLDIKILHIHVDQYKVYNITISPILQNTEYITPIIFRKTEAQSRNILLLGQCTVNRIHSVLKTNKQLYNFEVEFLTNNSTIDFTAEKDLKYYASFDAYVVFLPLQTLVPINTDYSTLNYIDLVLETCKEKTILYLENLIQNYINIVNKPTFICGFMVPQTIQELSMSSGLYVKRVIERLNNFIEDFIIVKKQPNLFYLDIDTISNILGKKNLMDDIYSNIYHSRFNSNDDDSVTMIDWFLTTKQSPSSLIQNCIEPIDINFARHTSLHNLYGESPVYVFGDMFISKIEQQLRIINQTDIVKLIIFDLDNTLIRGALVENYLNTNVPKPDNATWGDGVKEALNTLKSRGVLLALCTKNDENVVKTYLNDCTYLQLNMFTIIKANFKPKSENIREILSELHLTAKSAVFIDDNPQEQQEVKTMIPDLRVVPYNRHSLKRDLLWSPETQRVDVNSVNIQESYSKILERNTLEKKLTRQDYLKELKIETDIVVLNNVDCSVKRCHELINKTNQFNTTGVRREYNEFCEFIKNNTVIYFSVKDKTQDYGIVGTMLFNKQTDTIEQFIMSCRVIGLDVENYVLKWFLNREDTPKTVKAKFIKTELNSPCQRFYEKNNFVYDEALQTWSYYNR